MRIEEIADIKDIFSIFHDGGISFAEHRDDLLALEVDIQYLAERVKPEYRKFKVILYGFKDAEFSTWPSDLNSEPQKIDDVTTIFKPELEILEASVKDNKIEVVCNQHSSEYDYCGGELLFAVDSAEVHDEAGKSYSIDELDVICRGYWDDWAAKNE